MIKVLVFLLVLSLAGNVYPWFNVVVVLLFVPAYFCKRPDSKLAPDYKPAQTLFWAKLAYAFWLTSYLLTRAPLTNLFSYDFLRRDGALLFAYCPLFLIGNYGLDQAFVRRAVNFYLSLMSGIAVAGGWVYLEKVGHISAVSRLIPTSLPLVVYSDMSGYEFHGFFEAHNATGAVYGLSCCLAFALLVFFHRGKIWSLPTFWFISCFIGLMLSKSRTAYTGFAVTAMFVLVVKMHNLKRALKLTALLLVPLAYFVLLQPQVAQRTSAVTSFDDPNVANRFLYFQKAAEDFVRSPLIGIGFGRYNDEGSSFSGIRGFVDIATGGEVINAPTHAHNSYLHFLAEGGLLGFGLMMAIWISVYRWSGSMQSRFRMGSFSYALAIGVQACVLFEFFDSLTEHSMGTAVTSLFVFTMLGLLRNLIPAGAARKVPLPMGIDYTCKSKRLAYESS